MSALDHLGFLITGERTPRAPFTGPQEGLVVAADASGLTVKIPTYSPDWKFGPCRWARPSSTAGFPPAGTPCLIVFAGGDDLSHPWVVAFAGWPA